MKNVVIVGQGYVGLPLAQAASKAGHLVTGLEQNPTVCQSLGSGRSHVDDLSDGDIREMLSRGYTATADPTCIETADVVVICVPTPLGDEGGPDLAAVESAARSVAQHMRARTLVVLESTTYPGTTEEVLLPLLEREDRRHGEDFLLAFSPERVDPGNANYSIKNTPKLVGGLSREATDSAEAFYAGFIDTVVPLSGAKEAEMAKLLENTYRHVNIALVNEMAKFCHDLGIDIWEVIRGAATKPFGFQKFLPGPGVGGHCIPIDPNYLSHQVRTKLGYQFRFVELAQEINQSMPAYVVLRLQDLLNDRGLPLRGSTVLLLGVTYKPNIADQRESPAIPLAGLLRAKGAVVSFHDPHVTTWHAGGSTYDRVGDLESAVAAADAVVLLQQHSEYDISRLGSLSQLMFDTRGVAQDARTVRL